MPRSDRPFVCRSHLGQLGAQRQGLLGAQRHSQANVDPPRSAGGGGHVVSPRDNLLLSNDRRLNARLSYLRRLLPILATARPAFLLRRTNQLLTHKKGTLNQGRN